MNWQIQAQKPQYINNNIFETANQIKVKLEGQVKTTTYTSGVVYHILYKIQNGGRLPS